MYVCMYLLCFLFIFERESRERRRIPSRLHAVSTEPGTGLDPVTLRS